MRNVWKGLVVGGLTGVFAGVVLDAFTKAAGHAEEAGRQVRSRAPELLEKARQVAGEAAEAIKAADLPEKARQVAGEAAEAIKAADLPDKARQVAEATAERARELDLTDKAKQMAEKAREATGR
jgi:hypothetical protein